MKCAVRRHYGCWEAHAGKLRWTHGTQTLRGLINTQKPRLAREVPEPETAGGWKNTGENVVYRHVLIATAGDEIRGYTSLWSDSAEPLCVSVSVYRGVVHAGLKRPCDPTQPKVGHLWTITVAFCKCIPNDLPSAFDNCAHLNQQNGKQQ